MHVVPANCIQELLRIAPLKHHLWEFLSSTIKFECARVLCGVMCANTTCVRKRWYDPFCKPTKKPTPSSTMSCSSLHLEMLQRCGRYGVCRCYTYDRLHLFKSLIDVACASVRERATCASHSRSHDAVVFETHMLDDAITTSLVMSNVSAENARC